MKRVILSATNKKSSLTALAAYEKTIYNNENLYSVIPNYKDNVVEIHDRNGLAIIVKPDTVPVTVTRYKFVKATKADIQSGKQLYVKQSYEANTEKQVPLSKEELSIANRYKR